MLNILLQLLVIISRIFVVGNYHLVIVIGDFCVTNWLSDSSWQR